MINCFQNIYFALFQIIYTIVKTEIIVLQPLLCGSHPGEHSIALFFNYCWLLVLEKIYSCFWTYKNPLKRIFSFFFRGLCRFLKEGNVTFYHSTSNWISSNWIFVMICNNNKFNLIKSLNVDAIIYRSQSCRMFFSFFFVFG